MQRTITFLFALICLNTFFIETCRISAQSQSEGSCNTRFGNQLLKLDSVVVFSFTKYEYTYTALGQLESEKFYVASDSINLIYSLVESISNSYEGSKKTSSVVSNNYDGNLKPTTRSLYAYNNDDNLSEESIESFYSSKWNSRSKSNYTYLGNGLLSEILHYEFVRNSFSLSARAEYIYADQSKLLMGIVNKAINWQNEWVNKTKTEFVYNTDKLVAEMNFYWNDTINDWIATSKKEFIYNQSNSNQLIYRESNNWNGISTTTLEKNITLDISCPAENLLLPFVNNIPFKVEKESIEASNTTSEYHYSPFIKTGIVSVISPSSITLSNPSRNVVSIHSGQQIDLVEFHDLAGRINAVYADSFENLNVSSLARGIYSVKIKSNGKNTTTKFVKY